MVKIGQKYSRIRIDGELENRTNIFENQNSWRESNRSYSRTRIHGENRTEVFENQNSWRESNGSIRESEFMVRIGQKFRELGFMARIGQIYSRIRIHVENRTEVFEN